jgi:hypothetical protein
MRIMFVRKVVGLHKLRPGRAENCENVVHGFIPQRVLDDLAGNIQHDLCRVFTDDGRFALFLETDKAHLLIGITPIQTVTRRAATIGHNYAVNVLSFCWKHSMIGCAAMISMSSWCAARHGRDQMFISTVHDAISLFRIKLFRHGGGTFDIAEKNSDDTALAFHRLLQMLAFGHCLLSQNDVYSICRASLNPRRLMMGYTATYNSIAVQTSGGLIIRSYNGSITDTI